MLMLVGIPRGYKLATSQNISRWRKRVRQDFLLMFLSVGYALPPPWDSNPTIKTNGWIYIATIDEP